MKVTTDKYATYIYIKEWSDDFRPLSTQVLAPGVHLDFNKTGELVGIEILESITNFEDNR